MNEIKHNEKLVTGSSWIKLSDIHLIDATDEAMIEVPLPPGRKKVKGEAMFRFVFGEKQVTEIEDKRTSNPVGNLHLDFDPNNPIHVDILNKLNGIYTVLRAERDANL